MTDEAGGFIALTTKDHPQEDSMKISIVHVFTLTVQADGSFDSFCPDSMFQQSLFFNMHLNSDSTTRTRGTCCLDYGHIITRDLIRKTRAADNMAVAATLKMFPLDLLHLVEQLAGTT